MGKTAGSHLQITFTVFPSLGLLFPAQPPALCEDTEGTEDALIAAAGLNQVGLVGEAPSIEIWGTCLLWAAWPPGDAAAGTQVSVLPTSHGQFTTQEFTHQPQPLPNVLPHTGSGVCVCQTRA